jgi:hypothetical protein
VNYLLVAQVCPLPVARFDGTQQAGVTLARRFMNYPEQFTFHQTYLRQTPRRIE